MRPPFGDGKGHPLLAMKLAAGGLFVVFQLGNKTGLMEPYDGSMTTGGPKTISDTDFAELAKKYGGIDGAAYHLMLQDEAERDALLRELDVARRVQ